MYDIMIFIKGKVNGKKVTDLYRDNVLGYVIRNKYDPLTKSEYTEIEFCIKDNGKNSEHMEIVDIVGEFTIKIKEMKMTKDEFIKAYLNSCEQISEVVENILKNTIDGKHATKEEMDKYIKEAYERRI